MKIIPTPERFVGHLRAKLRAIRAESKTKNSELAEAVDVSESTVSGWLTGSGGVPRIDQLYLLVSRMGYDLSSIILSATNAASQAASRGE